MDKLYKGCCEYQTNLPSLAADDEVAKELAEMVRQVYNQTGIPKEGIFKGIVEYFAKKLWGGVIEGYGNDLVTVDYDTPDYNMLSALQKNVWQFSSAKNYNQLVSLSKALVDDEGKLRSFEVFKEVAKDINDKFVNQWLRTEYDLCISGSQMASKWVDIQANKTILPLLEFDAVIDSQTTDLCRSLNGTVRPVDDAFWKIYYPPNHFGERSTVRQTSGKAQTPDSHLPAADIPEMFKTNLAEQGLIFPKDHAYFDGVPKDVLREAVIMMPRKNG